jgi:gliding motility-associated-like protein
LESAYYVATVMRSSLPYYLRVLLLIIPCISFYRAGATHIVGGDISYQFLGSTIAGNSYEVSLTIYEDCLNGTPGAIAADDPAFVAVFAGSTQIILDSAHFTSSITVPANFNSSCVSNIPPTCLYKKTFLFHLILPPSPIGYTIAYQRCCRNAALMNIVQPANSGATYFCTIPPSTVAATNSSAVFNNFPPQIICVNNPLVYNNAATDADGDSLSYELCNSYYSPNGFSNDTITPPPYQYADYVSPFTYAMPLTAFPVLQIDPVSGIISGTPNLMGRYLVTICCHEWRNGQMINTVQREFQFVVTNCSKMVRADIPLLAAYPNTFKLNCHDHNIQFINTSIGGVTWKWDFGVAGIYDDTSHEFEPKYTYPDTGTYNVKLIANPGTTCTDSIIRRVRIYPDFKAEFEYAGIQCEGPIVQFSDKTISTIRPVDKWKWYFGDGDSSFEQNPRHGYLHSGAYNVLFVAENVNNCVDTILKQMLIDHFRPFAGKDTVIVKGESILFNATGGTEYTWTPSGNLSNAFIHDPIGFFPDTGLYSYHVHIVSPYGCAGDDTINILVVNQAEFFLPTAFTPNGDGRNDIFRPIAVGYKTLNYFRVYNRWGEKVYFGQSLDAGWDGTYNNKKADLGTYFWEISFTDRFGKDAFLKGDVTLLR